MPRRRRPGGTAARAPEPEGRLRAPLAALFPDGLPPAPQPPPPAPPEPRLISEKELMAQAFAALATGAALDLDAVRVVVRLPERTRPKGHAPSDSTPPARPAAQAPPPPSPAPAGASAPPREVFALQRRAWAGADWRDDPVRARAHARAAAELVARARRGRLPTLRLRGLRREPAVEALIAFVARERAARSRYVRVVTGKGLGSPGDPVLKEALAAWCASAAGEEAVVAWAPELDVRGEYGAVILQLRPIV